MPCCNRILSIITLAGLALLIGLGRFHSALAQNTSTAAEAMRSCTKCHDETEKYPVLSILKSRHAVMADPSTPFADQTCMSCHGKSDQHLIKPATGQPRAAPDVVFREGSPTPVRAQNDVCLQCHEQGQRLHWRGSAHAFQGLACTSCHTLHTGDDPVLTRSRQAETCYICHQAKRAESFLPSGHPIREGKMGCADCHNSHGSTGPSLLVKGTVNETCYTCHAEKRGPFLWEHAPVREDCNLCHKPHGSVHASLLKNRGPWLCQQCHLAQFHPSTAYSGSGLPSGPPPSGAQQLLAKNCMNCHSEVHGSNHPSGVRLTR